MHYGLEVPKLHKTLCGVLALCMQNCQVAQLFMSPMSQKVRL